MVLPTLILLCSKEKTNLKSYEKIVLYGGSKKMDLAIKMKPFPYHIYSAIGIATGGVMHMMWLLLHYNSSHSSLTLIVWLWASIVYPLCSVGVFLKKRLAIWITFLSPLTGGIFILLALSSNYMNHLLEIPAGFSNGLSPIGFGAIISETFAASYALVLLRNKTIDD